MKKAPELDSGAFINIRGSEGEKAKVYEYSPIKSIIIKNFRNIGDAQLDFTESPIIALIGDNEAGKTSIVKSFGVCALHANARDQKDYIRDGTNGFGVAIELEDTSLITRMKTTTLNKYSVKDANGDIWESNKIDAGLPVQVSKLMGMIEEPETKEFLHIRTYEDKLLFVVTPASTNYKVMYDALKVDQLTRAIKLGSTESNELKSRINDNNTSAKTLTESLKNIRIYDLEALTSVKNRMASQLATLDKLERAKSILDNINSAKNQLGALRLIAEHNLTELDLVEANKLTSVSRLLSSTRKLNKLLQLASAVSSAESIDLTVINKLRSTIEKRNNLSSKIQSAGALIRLSELKEIKEYEAQQLNRAITLRTKVITGSKIRDIISSTGCNLIEQKDFDIVFKVDKMRKTADRNSLLEAEATKSLDIVNQISNYLKQCGAAVIVCGRCGGSTVIDTETLNVAG